MNGEAHGLEWERPTLTQRQTHLRHEIDEGRRIWRTGIVHAVFCNARWIHRLRWCSVSEYTEAIVMNAFRSLFVLAALYCLPLQADDILVPQILGTWTTIAQNPDLGSLK